MYPGTALLIWITAFLAARPGFAEDLPQYAAHTYENTAGGRLNYLLHTPPGYQAAESYPLVINFHGYCGVETCTYPNAIQNWKWGRYDSLLVCDSIQQKHPSFVLAPRLLTGDQRWVDVDYHQPSYSINQVSRSVYMRLAGEIIDKIISEFSIDTGRMYVTGFSMGGFAVWDLILRNPRRYSAAIPISGAGDPSAAEDIAHMPIKIFHSGTDTTVPYAGSRLMYNDLQQACGNCSRIDYHEFAMGEELPGVSDSLTFSQLKHYKTAFNVSHVAGLMDWLFAHRKPATALSLQRTGRQGVPPLWARIDNDGSIALRFSGYAPRVDAGIHITTLQGRSFVCDAHIIQDGIRLRPESKLAKGIYVLTFPSLSSSIPLVIR
ncbi:MAG: hypothetical protein GF398_05165 [Chitinivibrionales bacterium]|nr:hypothetical protein [Chitinivibrionales bacterium]